VYWTGTVGRFFDPEEVFVALDLSVFITAMISCRKFAS
jgi:hypothetical protein